MTSVEISQEALDALLPRLSRPPASASRTHLPTILPLAFPTPLHLLNTLAAIHIVSSILSQPIHTRYFAETGGSATDTAIMGVLGLYLSSDAPWSTSNMLSTAAWKDSKLDEALLSEVFRIETTREKEHETMKGIRVGGRWDPGARVVEDLVAFFKGSAGILGKTSCVGEWVKKVVDDAWTEGDDVEVFVRNCCDWATSVCPSLRDPYELPDGVRALPAAPLRLVHALAVRQEASHDLDLRLPKPAQLEDLSPLPVSVPALLFSGMLTLPTGNDNLKATIDRLAASAEPHDEQVEVDSETYTALLARSVEACQRLREAVGTTGMSHLDICLAVQSLAEEQSRSGTLVLIPASA